MKKVLILQLQILLIVGNIAAQKLIPFQNQSQKQWDYNAKWGYMTESRQIVFTPVFYTNTPSIINQNYIVYGTKMMDVKTQKIIWDSIETKDVAEIRGNIVSIKMPLRGPNNFQPYSFKNINTKKIIAEEGRFANIDGYVVTEGGGSQGVINEQGKVIIERKQYQDISKEAKECFVAKSEYDGFNNIYNLKGEKLNAVTYNKLQFGSNKKSLIIGQRLIDNTKNIYELIFHTPQGKEVGNRLFCIKKEKFDLFKITASGYAISTNDVTIYSNKLCNAESKLKSNVIVNSGGVITMNSDSYKEINSFNDVIFKAKDSLGRDYMINEKGEKIADFFLGKGNLVISNSPNSFMKITTARRELQWYIYDAKTGKANNINYISLPEYIKIEDWSIAFDKYYLVKVIDGQKKQYATYIYDNNGKLVLNSEDGFWMFENGFLIKYLVNEKKEKLYLGYYDVDLNPYSKIKE